MTAALQSKAETKQAAQGALTAAGTKSVTSCSAHSAMVLPLSSCAHLLSLAAVQTFNANARTDALAAAVGSGPTSMEIAVSALEVADAGVPAGVASQPHTASVRATWVRA